MVSGDKYARENFWKHQRSAKEARAASFRLSFPTKLIKIANFTIRINQPLLVESKAFDWYIFSLYNVVYWEIIGWLKSLRESELWPVCSYCKYGNISSSHRYVYVMVYWVI